MQFEITTMRIANVFKCICCGSLYYTFNEMGFLCSLKCEALILRALSTSETTNVSEEEYFEWMLTKSKGIKILALDLLHPNKKIRERAERESKA